MLRDNLLKDIFQEEDNDYVEFLQKIFTKEEIEKKIRELQHIKDSQFQMLFADSGTLFSGLQRLIQLLGTQRFTQILNQLTQNNFSFAGIQLPREAQVIFEKMLNPKKEFGFSIFTDAQNNAAVTLVKEALTKYNNHISLNPLPFVAPEVATRTPAAVLHAEDPRPREFSPARVVYENANLNERLALAMALENSLYESYATNARLLREENDLQEGIRQSLETAQQKEEAEVAEAVRLVEEFEIREAVEAIEAVYAAAPKNPRDNFLRAYDARQHCGFFNAEAERDKDAVVGEEKRTGLRRP